jgi:nucleoside 2-deoxyribosyltransferase
MEKIKIFYAFSNNDDMEIQRKLYDGIFVKLNNTHKYYVYDTEENSENQNGIYRIDQGIFNKIDECDLFIADVTPESAIDSENIDGKGVITRYKYNPNMMCELGYALAKLKPEQIITFYNTEKIDPVDLPFNIKTLKMKKYSAENNEEIDETVISLCDENESFILLHLKTLNIYENIMPEEVVNIQKTCDDTKKRIFDNLDNTLQCMPQVLSNARRYLESNDIEKFIEYFVKILTDYHCSQMSNFSYITHLPYEINNLISHCNKIKKHKINQITDLNRYHFYERRITNFGKYGQYNSEKHFNDCKYIEDIDKIINDIKYNIDLSDWVYHKYHFSNKTYNKLTSILFGNEQYKKLTVNVDTKNNRIVIKSLTVKKCFIDVRKKLFICNNKSDDLINILKFEEFEEIKHMELVILTGLK